jgi:hypothetical protein
VIKRHYNVSLIKPTSLGTEYRCFDFWVKSFFRQDARYLKNLINEYLGENHGYVIISLNRL